MICITLSENMIEFNDLTILNIKGNRYPVLEFLDFINGVHGLHTTGP